MPHAFPECGPHPNSGIESAHSGFNIFVAIGVGEKLTSKMKSANPETIINLDEGENISLPVVFLELFTQTPLKSLSVLGF